MKLFIQTFQLQINRETVSGMERRLRFALSRFDSAISRVTVRLTGLNGFGEGVDRECLIVVKLRRGNEVVVRGKGKDCNSTLDYCADRVSRAVARELSRDRFHLIRRMCRMQKPEKNVSCDEEYK